MRKLRAKVSPGVVLGTVALVVALTGTSIALPGKNSVDSGDIKKNAVRSADVKNQNLKGVDVAPNTLTGADVNESTLGQVPSANNASNLGGAPASSYLTQSQGDSRYLPGASTTRVQVSPDNWEETSGGGTVNRFSGQAQLAVSGATSNEFFNASLALPSSLQGRSVSVQSFELCYNAADASTLDRVFLFKITDATAATPFPSGTTPIDDDTDRDDITCRTYAAASPVTIGPNDFAQVVIRADYSAAGSVDVGRLTVNLATS